MPKAPRRHARMMRPSAEPYPVPKVDDDMISVYCRLYKIKHNKSSNIDIDVIPACEVLHQTLKDTKDDEMRSSLEQSLVYLAISAGLEGQMHKWFDVLPNKYVVPIKAITNYDDAMSFASMLFASGKYDDALVIYSDHTKDDVYAAKMQKECWTALAKKEIKQTI